MDEHFLREAVKTLSPRQRQVLQLLTTGRTQKEISQELDISVAAVKYHLTHIYTKLNISHLTPAQRQRLLGQLAPALSQALASEDFVRPDEARLIEQPDEPNQYALAVIEAVSAVVEDAHYELVSVPTSPSRRQRSVWKKVFWTFMPLITCFSLGVGVTLLLPQSRRQVVQGRNDSAADPLAETSSLPPRTATTATAASSIPAAVGVAAGAVSHTAGVCGETRRTTASAQDRFLRQQGVSVFSTENTGGTVTDNTVRSLAIDRSGLWIGYFGSPQHPADGVGHFDKQTWAMCGMPSGIAGNNINDIEIDQTGQVWFATESSGVAMFDGTQWHSYTTATDPGLPDNRTFGLTIDSENTVWLATLEGIAHFDGQHWATVYTAENKTIEYNNTHDIAFDRSGNIWVGHISNGVSVYQQAHMRWLHYEAGSGGLGGNLIRSIVVQPGQAGADAVWIATADGGVSVYQRGSWKVYRQNDGLPSNTVTEVALDPLGRVWAATDQGVAYFNGNHWIRYHSLPSRSIAFGADCQQCPFEDNDHVWTGTIDSGLTHSRLPYNKEALTITEVCFVVEEQNHTCERFPQIELQDNQPVITLTYPRTLHPGESFQVEFFAAPHTPHEFNEGDMLVSMDEKPDESNTTLFKTHVHIAVKGSVESGQPYKFVDYNKPFVAPELPPDVQEQVFTSTWRMWMHTRYAGPLIRIQFKVREEN